MTPAPAAAERPARAPAAAMALSTLAVLTAINLLNYLDRYVLAGVLPDVRAALRLPADRAGLLQSAFVVSYLLASPLAGYFGDRTQRRLLVALGVGVWSLATVASGLAATYPHLLAARALTGVGEAGYATVAPALIADLFARERRGKMLAVFYSAIPVGSALGIMLGGAVAQRFGWRYAFYVAGAPGLALACTALFLEEPVRGAQDEGPTVGAIPLLKALTVLGTNRAYLFINAGYTLLTFTLGGLALWMPSFFHEVHGVATARADLVFGAIIVVAGFGGTAVGGLAGDVAVGRHPGGYLWVSGAGLLAGAPLALAAALVGSLPLAYALALGAIFFLFFNSGPINAALVSCVPANLRASAVALNIVCIHLLGDATSPFLIGLAARHVGMRAAVAATALPLLLAGLLLLWGARRVAALPSPIPSPNGEGRR